MNANIDPLQPQRQEGALTAATVQKTEGGAAVATTPGPHAF